MKKLNIIYCILLMSSCAANPNNSLIEPTFEESSQYKEHTLDNSLLMRKSNELVSNNDLINNDEYISFANKLNLFSAKVSSLSFQEENLILSPLSIYFNLTMLSQITDNDSKNEILSALEMTSFEVDSFTKLLYSNLTKSYNTHGYETTDCIIDNSIWLDNNFNKKESCLKNLSENFYTSSYEINFSNNLNSNLLISEHIKKETKNLLNISFDFSSETRLTLLSSIYFHDIWDSCFNDLLTIENKEFINNDGNKISTVYLQSNYLPARIVMTNQYSSFYCETLYGYKLKFIVPNDGYSIKDIYTKEIINSVNSNYYQNENSHFTRCIFPEFKIENNSNISPILKDKLNVNSIFTKNADFSTLTNESIVCDKIVHNAVIDVNKKGIEAAAVTYEELISSSVIEGDITFEDFEINKNFIFLLTDKNDVILFSGTLLNL